MARGTHLGQTAPFYQELGDFGLCLLFLEGVSEATPGAVSPRLLLGSDDHGTVSSGQVHPKAPLGIVDIQIVTSPLSYFKHSQLTLSPRGILHKLSKEPEIPWAMAQPVVFGGSPSTPPICHWRLTRVAFHQWYLLFAKATCFLQWHIEGKYLLH